MKRRSREREKKVNRDEEDGMGRRVEKEEKVTEETEKRGDGREEER